MSPAAKREGETDATAQIICIFHYTIKLAQHLLAASGAPNENIVQNLLNIALLIVF